MVRSVLPRQLDSWNRLNSDLASLRSAAASMGAAPAPQAADARSSSPRLDLFSKDTFEGPSLPSGSGPVRASSPADESPALSAPSGRGALASGSLDALLRSVVSVLQSLVASLGKMLGGAPSSPQQGSASSPGSPADPQGAPSEPATGASSEPATGAPSESATGAPPSPGAPEGSPSSGAPSSGSQPGAPVGDFQTRHWGGDAAQFDKVYQFKGDDSSQPSFGGWAWSKPDTNAIAKAGFNWFEVGYPTTLNQSEYQNLRDQGVRPIAYVNMGEVSPDLRGQVGSVPVLKHNGDWNTDVVDVRDPHWQDWLVQRADFAYDRGARGIKWDCAGVESNYKDPAEKKQAVDAMASVLDRVRQQHPDMKNVVNQGYGLANARPDLVDGVETESLMSARDQGGGMTQWANEEIAKVAEIHQKYGTPIFMADYADPNGGTAQRWANDIAGMGFTPYITNVQWNIPGRGLNIAPGW